MTDTQLDEFYRRLPPAAVDCCPTCGGRGAVLTRAALRELLAILRGAGMASTEIASVAGVSGSNLSHLANRTTSVTAVPVSVVDAVASALAPEAMAAQAYERLARALGKG